MDCPECDGPLDAYVLGGREAVTCTRCGWVGIEADHRGTEGADESWDEALGRFYDRNAGTARRRADLPPVAPSTPERSPDEQAADGADEQTADGADEQTADGADEQTADGADGGSASEGRDADVPPAGSEADGSEGDGTADRSDVSASGADGSA